jgi:hypothetical protein
VEERTTSVAVDVLNVCGGQVVLCIIAPNFVTLLGQVRSCIPFTNLRHSAREKAKTPRAARGFNREHLQALRWPALPKGLVLSAFGTRGRRGW